MSQNNTTPSMEIGIDFSDVRITVVLVYSIVFAIGVPGNILVIYIFGWVRRNQRKNSDRLLYTLGMWDLLCTFVVPPVTIAIALLPGGLLWVSLVCVCSPLLLVLGVTVSQCILILICYDRYRAIATPLQPIRCESLSAYSVVFGIVLSIVLSLPIMIQVDLDLGEKRVCFDFEHKSHLILLQSTLLITRDFVTIIIMTYLTHIMIKTLKRSEIFRRNLQSSGETKDFNRTRRILHIVLAVFKILILPFDIYLFSFVVANLRGPNLKTNHDLLNVLGVFMIVQVTNSVANIFIYSALHPDFKTFIRKQSRRICLACNFEIKVNKRRQKATCSSSKTNDSALNTVL